MDLHSFVLSCLRPFAEGRVTVGGHSCPADFGGANFSVPWATRKADFAADLNFFTASPIKGGGNKLNFHYSQVTNPSWKIYLYREANSFRVALPFCTASSKPCWGVFFPEKTFSISASVISRIAKKFPRRIP